MLARCKKDFAVAVADDYEIVFKVGILYEIFGDNYREDVEDLSTLPTIQQYGGGILVQINNYDYTSGKPFSESPEFAEHFILGDEPLPDVDPEILEQAQAARILLGEEE